MKLHLNSTVQRRAAELKLQHEVNLRTNEEREQPAQVIHFTRGKVKREWADSRVERTPGGRTFDWERNTG